MFGTLVVVLPAPYEGGQLSFRTDDSDRHWIVDFKEPFAEATKTSVCFVAFFGDVEHQVLPVVSGYHVTLTYNLYFRAKNSIPRALSGPFYSRLKEALIELVNDQETLPSGGYLGLGLCHQYAYDESEQVELLLDKLKGSDAVLASVCAELGLPCTLRLLYVPEDLSDLPYFYLLSRFKLYMTGPETFSNEGRGLGYNNDNMDLLLNLAVRDLTLQDLEGVDIIGRPMACPDSIEEEDDTSEHMNKFFKDPISQVLEVKEMSSVLWETSLAHYGKDSFMETFYGKACMMILVEPKESRKHLSL